MPVVPRRDPAAIAMAPLPGVRVSTGAPAGAFGGLPQAPDVSGLQQHATAMIDREQQHADQIAVLDADNKLAALQDSLLYDPNTGALNRRGKDAMGATADVTDGWQKGASEIATGLTTDRQQEAFARASSARFQQIHEAVERHAASESDAYDRDTSTAAVSNRFNDAVKNYATPGAVSDAIDESKAILTDYGRRNGWSADAIAQKTAAAESGIHVGVINRMLANGQDLTASAYYAAHKDGIGGDAAAQVEQALQEGSVRGASQRQSDAIVAKAPTLTAALGEVKGIADPRVRDATEDRVRKYFTEQTENARVQRDALMQQATNVVEQSRDPNRVPPAVWNQLTLGERGSLREYAEKLQKGTPIATNWTTYYDLKSLASSPDTRDQFLKTSLLDYRSQLSDAEFKELVDVQAELRKGSAKATDELGHYFGVETIVNGSLKGAGLNIEAKPGTPDAQNVALFRHAVEQQLGTIEQRTGKRPTDAETQGVVDNLLVTGRVAGTGVFSNDTRPVYQRNPGDRLILSIRDVPAAEQRKIRATLQANGQPVTDQAVLHLYGLRLGQIPAFQRPP